MKEAKEVKDSITVKLKFSITNSEDCELSKDLNKLMEEKLYKTKNISPVQKRGK